MTHKTVSKMLEIHQTYHLHPEIRALTVRDYKQIITEIFQDFSILIGIH